MALHPAFPVSPYEPLEPATRQAQAHAGVFAWRASASRARSGPSHHFVCVDEAGFERHLPASLAEMATMFREYQPTESK